MTGHRIARELDRIADLRGLPLMIVSDNGTELSSHATTGWQAERGLAWYYIAPGKPMQNGLVAIGGCATNASTNTCSRAC